MTFKKSLIFVSLFAATIVHAEETDSIFYKFPNSEINFEALYSNPANGCACVEDFNKDGYPDLIVTGPNYEDYDMAYVNLLINEQGKSFKRYDLGLQPVSNGSIAATEIGDRIWLLAVQGGGGVTATTNNSVAYVVRLNMKGATPVANKMQDLDKGLYNGDILFVDFTGDGKKDIVQFGGSRKVYCYINNGSNRFSLHTGVTNLKGTNYGQCRLSDLNGDGREDILAIDQVSGLMVYLNQGDSTFSATKVSSTANFKSSPRIGIGDFNEDGRTDIVAFDYSSLTTAYTVLFFYQNGQGVFEEAAANDFMGVAEAAVEVADFNGDGHADVLYSGHNVKVRKGDKENVTCAKAYMLLGDGKGNFSQNVKWNTARNCPDIFCLAPVMSGHYYTADFDNDGISDIFALGQLGVAMGGKNMRRADMFLSSRTYGFGTPVEESLIKEIWQGFPYSEVRLREGRLKQANDKEIAYLKTLDINRLFASTLSYNLGINGYSPYGGNEANGYGCSFAHYTSAVSMAYAATGDSSLLERANQCVDIMRRSQDYNGDGFFAFKDGTTWGFDKMAKEKIITPYGWDENGHPWGSNDVGIPLYAHHKIFAALRDAYLYTGNEEARIGFLKLCDWMCMWLQNFDEVNLNKMLESEHGGMVEVLSDGYALSGKEKYLEAAERMTRDNFASAMSQHIDDLSGRHSNFHIPMAVGAAVHYRYSGDERSRLTAHNFFDIVSLHHTLCNGGNGNNERFGTPDLLTYRLGTRGPESCSSYNMLKLAKDLFCLEDSVKYLDYYENTLYNHILGTLSPKEGEGVCYHTSLKPGTFKCYDNLYNNFWCCVGSGMESHTKYVDAIFFHNDEDVLVNLYTPASLNWEEKGLRLTMNTSYPAGDDIHITLNEVGAFSGALCFRYPSWAGEGSMTVKVNGQEQVIAGHPGELVRIRSDWKASDNITVSIPPLFRLVDLPDDINVSAIFYGPVLLSASMGAVGQEYVGVAKPETDVANPAPEPYFPEIDHSRSQLQTLFRVVNRDSLIFETVGIEKNYRFKPFYNIHDERYNVYWKLADAADREEERKIIADHVIPGMDSNEQAHNVKSQNSNTGYGSFSFWGPTYFYYRNASITGSLSYDMQLMDRTLADDENYYLQVTYFGSEPSGYGGFRIYIDGKPISLVDNISYLAPLDFAQRYYKIPRTLTDGKSKVTVKFSDGRVSVYGLRMLTADHLKKEKPTALESVSKAIFSASYDGNTVWVNLPCEGHVALYDLGGRLAGQFNMQQGTASLPVALHDGLYFVVFSTCDSQSIAKILVKFNRASL